MAIDLIDEACVAGARQARACAILEIDVCTLRRWRRQQRDEQRLSDRRREAAADRVPANKLSPEERERILAVCNAPAYQSLPPSQIVQRLADEGEYLASESTFYRVLREDGQQNRRGRTQAPRQVPKSQGFKAEGPKQVFFGGISPTWPRRSAGSSTGCTWLKTSSAARSWVGRYTKTSSPRMPAS